MLAEAAARAAADAAASDGNGKMRLVGPGSTGHHGVAPLRDEAAAGNSMRGLLATFLFDPSEVSLIRQKALLQCKTPLTAPRCRLGMSAVTAAFGDNGHASRNGTDPADKIRWSAALMLHTKQTASAARPVS